MVRRCVAVSCTGSPICGIWLATESHLPHRGPSCKTTHLGTEHSGLVKEPELVIDTFAFVNRRRHLVIPTLSYPMILERIV